MQFSDTFMRPAAVAYAAVVLFMVALTSGLLPSMAQAQTMRPGLYEYTSKTEVMGMQIPMAFKQCVTQKDIDSNEVYANGKKSTQGCTPPEVVKTGNILRVKYVCAQPKITGEATGNLRDDGFTILMKSVMHEQNAMVVSTQLNAQRIGGCAP